MSSIDAADAAAYAMMRHAAAIMLLTPALLAAMLHDAQLRRCFCRAIFRRLPLTLHAAMRHAMICHAYFDAFRLLIYDAVMCCCCLMFRLFFVLHAPAAMPC